MKKNVTIIVPMRSGSKGIKNKNIKEFVGLPLYHWTIKKLYHLFKQGKIDKIIISSDSDWYFERIKLSFGLIFGEELIFSKRLDSLGTDLTTTEEVCLNELKKYEIYDGILGIVEVTSPLIPIDSLSFMLSAVDNDFYSSFLVYKDIGQFWKCNNDTDYKWRALYTDRKMRQEETEILYREVGAWAIKVDKFIEYKNRIIEPCIPIVINKEYGLSINTEEDFYYAEYLMKENAPQIFAHTGVYE